jgi:hypothetical protein
MAMMDDRAFLVSHIRQSFITSDDTGMCEAVIEPDTESERRGTDQKSDQKPERNVRPTTWHAGQG